LANTDYSVQPAAQEDAKVDARSAAKWLIAAFAAVGAVLISGIGFSSIGDLHDWDLGVAITASVIGVGSVISAVMLIGDVLTPDPVTLKDLAELEDRRNAGKGKKNDDLLIGYLEGNPSFLQGIAGETETNESLGNASRNYEAALEARYRTSEAVWKARENDASKEQIETKRKTFEVADAKADTIHRTVRRLEMITAAQKTVLKLRGRRKILAALAATVALCVGAFAFVSSSPDLEGEARGTVLERVNLTGANLRAANFGGVTIRRSNFKGTDLEGADLRDSRWVGTICPDGTNSNQDGHTCVGHLKPAPKPKPLP
jgi:hypothetical protein